MLLYLLIASASKPFYEVKPNFYLKASQWYKEEINNERYFSYNLVFITWWETFL